MTHPHVRGSHRAKLDDDDLKSFRGSACEGNTDRQTDGRTDKHTRTHAHTRTCTNNHEHTHTHTHTRSRLNLKIQTKKTENEYFSQVFIRAGGYRATFLPVEAALGCLFTGQIRSFLCFYCFLARKISCAFRLLDHKALATLRAAL